jgi:hypothetical protein
MNAQLGIDTHEKRHMIRHHFECFDLCLVLRTSLTNDLFEPLIKRRRQDLSPLFRTPDHMIVAGTEHIAAAFVGRLNHRSSIEHNVISVKTFVLDPQGCCILGTPC